MISNKLISYSLALLILVALTIIFAFAKNITENKFKTTLKYEILQVKNKLQIILERHSYLPSKLASDKDVLDFLKRSPSSLDYKQTQEDLNLSLELSNNISGSSHIFVLNSEGEVISSSNWDEKDSFIGQNYSKFPYFEQASQNVLGRYFSPQQNAEEHFYYFARSVLHKNNLIGIVVVQSSLSDIVYNWTVANIDFVLTDNNGKVFLTTNSEWKKQRFYNHKDFDSHTNLLYEESFEKTNIQDQKYLMLSEYMPLEGWDVRLLSNYSIVKKEISRIIFISTFLILLLAALAGLIFKIQNQRREFQKQTTEQLEKKVLERTQALKKSQEDLIQAAKMAALGQLSIGITHEINNPLTAIRAYAENANQFLEKDRLDRVALNLEEITKLTENLESITGQLKSFSRKSKGQLKAVNLDQALNNAIAIVHSKIVSSGTEINYESGSIKAMVLADEVWLSQVLVNLISNAISATNKNEVRKVNIDIKEKINNDIPYSCIEIRDNGTGIEENNLSRIFEPFFTTKPMKKGLGLGLSISFNLVKDMNGSLDARNRKVGGALFTLCLAKA